MKLLSCLRFIIPILIIGLTFSSCTKEDIDTTPTPTPQEEVATERVEQVITRNELGVFANASSCDCYGPFEDIDWENLTEEEIQAQVEAAIASMTEEEMEALFTPVCADGIIYANACFAECEGITEYSVCDTEWDEDWDEEDWDDDVEWGCDFESLDFLACYELQFPVTVVFQDGSTVIVNDMDQFFEVIFTAGTESPELAYPINLTHFETGEEVTATSDEELAELSVECFEGPIGPGGPGGPSGPGGPFADDCVVNSYPLTLVVDGVNYTVTSDENFGEVLEEIFNNNPDVMEIEMGFPLTLTFVNGVVVEVNNDEEYFDAMVENCP